MYRLVDSLAVRPTGAGFGSTALGNSQPKDSGNSKVNLRMRPELLLIEVKTGIADQLRCRLIHWLYLCKHRFDDLKLLDRLGELLARWRSGYRHDGWISAAVWFLYQLFVRKFDPLQRCFVAYSRTENSKFPSKQGFSLG